MKKLFALTALSIVVFSGCKLWPFGSSSSTESALPKDSQYVVTIDYSNGEQVKNTKKLFEMLPDYGLKQTIKDEIFSEDALKKDGLNYENDILPVLEGDFKVSISIDLSKVKDHFQNGGIVVAIYSSEGGKMRDILAKKKAKDVFYGNDGNIFVFSSTQAEVDGALKRIKDGNGFSINENFKNASKNSTGNIGYVYFETGDGVKNFISGLGYDESTLANLNERMNVLKDVYIEIFAKEDGFGLGGFANLTSDNDLVAKNMPYFGKKLSLFEKIPLENPIVYWEMPNVGQYIENFIPDFAGISKDEAHGILQSQFAFAVGDSGEKYPTISLYLDVNEKYAGAAKKMIGALDAYVDAVIKEFEGMINVKGAVRKDINVVKGGGLNKLYIDFSAVPDELLANFNLIPGLDLKKMKIEIYYGLTGDNVLTVALYPEFNKVYGENIIGNDKDVLSSFEKNEKNSFDVVFFSPEKLINFVDTNYYKVAKDYGILTSEYEKNYALLKQTMQVLKYFVYSSSMPANDKVLFNAFLKLQELQKNNAIEKVKEGK